MTKNEELISIVVPVYNVEDYVERCAKSIFNQSYSNLEIIFIDDGSTDSSGKICDTFEKDKRVTVIHKENGGLSSARNAALPYLHGNYVTFIDSDDWVEPNFVKLMHDNAVKYKAEISAVGYFIAPEKKQAYSYFGKDVSCKVMSNKEALSTFLLHDGLGVTVWGKLYKTSLWDTVKCPEGKLHEDQYTTYKLLDLANRIVFDKHPMYYYYERSNSIGHSAFSNRSYDLYNGIHEEYNFISKKYPDVIDDAKLERDIWEVVFVNMMLRSDIKDPNVVKNVHQHIKEDMKLIIHSHHLSNIRKLQMILFVVSFRLYKKIYLRYI